MKTNVNLFIALILCAVIGGALYFLARPSQESLGWNPDEMYGDLSRSAYDGSAFTNATFSGSSNAGGVALSMQGGSLSSRTRAKSSRPITIQYPIANSQSPIANSQYPIANGQSPIAYMTSGAEYRSFGGGGNGNMGTAGTFRTNSQSPIANSQLPISNIQLPIAYSSVNTFSSYTPAEMYNAVATVSSYDAANAYSALPTRNGVRGRQNGNGTAGEAWWIWLDKWLATNGSGIGSGTDLGNGYYSDYGFTEDALLSAYSDFINNYWNPVMGGDEESLPYEEWKAWFFKSLGENGYYTYNGHTYYWASIGDIVPLLLFALLYIVAMCLRAKFRTQVNS